MENQKGVAAPYLPWEFSLFAGGMCTVHPSSVVVKDVNQLEKVFLTPPWKSASFPKKNLPCWSPAIYAPGDTRKNDNVQAITALVFDYDSPSWSASRMADHLREVGVAFAAHTTWSHTDESPRYRVVIFLSRRLAVSEFLPVRERVLGLIGYTDGVDDLKDLARHYALPMRRTSSPYESYLEAGLPYLCVDSLMKDKQASETSETDSDNSLLLPSTIVQISEAGETKTVGELILEGPEKYKCACPFQDDASFGSAFLRVCKDKRAFLQCTSERHDHESRQYWLNGKKEGEKSAGGGSRAPRHSVDRRKELLEHTPDGLVSYVETSLAFNFPQGVFYRREKGAWQIQSPLRRETVVNHLIGRMVPGMDQHHVEALVDHVLSRQVYGFDCDSARGAIIPSSYGPRLNLYAHPEHKAEAGDWPRIKTLIRKLCDDDEKAIEWLMHWSAALVQKPERRAMVAVLCLSPQQGIGKSMFGRILGAVIGRKNSSTVSNRALKDSFNASYITKLLVLADEVGMKGRDGDVIAALKAYITDDRVPCRAPYAARTEVDNRTTWWLTSNERRPLMLEEDDRRFTVLVPGDVDFEYKKMLSGCFNPATGDYSKSFLKEIFGFAHALHSLQVDYWLISRPFATQARSKLQAASRTSIDQFVRIVQKHGPAAAITDYPPGPDFLRVPEAMVRRSTPCELLYGSYLTWCSRHGRKDVYQESNLRLAIEEIQGVDVKRLLVGGQHMYCYLGLQAEEEKERDDNVVTLTSK